MKYTAPAVLNTVNATALIQGTKNGMRRDSDLIDPSPVAGYGADE
ncbi:hypothetical protein HNQ77_001666 [Silvibacterium bohemicum]|uniref:Uncharacterized protein n=1 Tax=Silvibacterium bohemicum TaxID=1577686 RepID=A0A841JTA1_9BACT|nr:hypothetical protein [Silvibacterium bohemicum]MBB6143717.1 hypothetical protein [Silvibacterium bohemicum]